MAFYFFDPSPIQSIEGLVRLWGVALAFVNGALDLDRKFDFVSHWPPLLERTITLTAIIILRLSRSKLSAHLDLEAGEKAYFNVVDCMKKASLQPGDLRTRAVSILSRLWTYQDVFKYPDGTVDSLRTRIRSRLSMSILFDCFLWFKDITLDRPVSSQPEDNGETPESGSLQRPDAPPAPQPSQAANGASSGPSISQPAAPSTGDEDVVMASVPISSNPMAFADNLNFATMQGFNEFQPYAPAAWMVPDYDWAANFEFSAETLPNVPWATPR
jgi:transcriptional regulatory protein LEU3